MDLCTSTTLPTLTKLLLLTSKCPTYKTHLHRLLELNFHYINFGGTHVNYNKHLTLIKSALLSRHILFMVFFFNGTVRRIK